MKNVKSIGKVIHALANANELSMRAIEINTKIRQPDVSLSLKWLKEHRFVQTREVPLSSGKGRTANIR